VRRFMRKVRKLEANNKSWSDISAKMSTVAEKILNDRVDVVVRMPLLLKRANGRGDPLPDAERLDRISDRIDEFDALITLVAPYFLCGTSARIGLMCASLRRTTNNYGLGGLINVVDYGVEDPKQRTARQNDARRLLKKYNWELPE